jgi:hypothetical protein
LIKVKVTPWHFYAGRRERWRYSSKPFAKLQFKEMGGQQNFPVVLSPRKTRHP